MLILILGVVLWWGAHAYKRLAPAQRDSMGERGRAMMTGLLVLALILMIIGYRSADGAFFWGPNSALVGINNLLVLVAFYLFAAAGMKTRITAHLRHPMLWGFATWAVAHLLVNGDTPSFVLFGGLLAWAFVQMALINSAGPWQRPSGPFPARKEAMAAVGAVIVMIVVGLIHGWIGPWPFGGA